MSNNFFDLRIIIFLNRAIPVCLQKQNGPCPLIALFNILLLRRVIILPLFQECISIERILALIVEAVFHKKEQIDDFQDVAELTSTILTTLNSLQYGLNINFKFDSIQSIEITPELSAFEFFGIKIFHGWIVEDEEVKDMIKNLSYNELIDLLIQYEEYDNCKKNECLADQAISNPLIKIEKIRSFIESTKSQMTYTGLFELREAIEEGYLCILFRNNHFSTLLKKNEQLYTLVTDDAYREIKDVAWELLDDVDGNSKLVSSDFEILHYSSSPEKNK